MKHGAVAVCIPSGGASAELLTRTLDSVRAHTATDIPVLTPSEGEEPFAMAAAADVVLIQPGCVVGDGWLEGLSEAVHASSTTATATALTQHDIDAPTSDNTFERAPITVRDSSFRLHPRLIAGAGPCVYVRRSALELVGGGTDFWERCLARGLSHVLADEVLVLDLRPGATRSAETARPRGPLARSLGAARRALSGLSAVIDARILHGSTTGTHVHVLELITALARTERVGLTAIVPNDMSEHARTRLESLASVSLRTYEEASRAARPRVDIVHRPFQLSNTGDLTFLAGLGERLVLTQQDLIAFHNPAYFPGRQTWEEYRRLTELALAAADRVVFFSAHARDDAMAEDLVAAPRASVVHIGVDHAATPRGNGPGPAPPPGHERLADGTPIILCLGSDFHHKNRVFALRVVERLKNRHGWPGRLVFAGPSVGHGSSREQEAQLLLAHPELAGAMIDVGPVSEAEKDWLFKRATLVLHPSVVEGFGLVPFEAAAHRVPCVWAPGSSLSELLPDDAAGIVPWDDGRSAERALELLGDPGARERNLNAIDRAAAGLTWDATATALLDVYRSAADAPANPAGTRGSDAFAGGAVGGLSEDAARLVGPGGELPSDVHRPLLALATHRRIAAPAFAALKFAYRASYELRRRREGHKRK